MNKITPAVLLCTAFLTTAPAWAEKRIVLKVNEMHCQLCAYQVNKTLREVNGVLATKADIQGRLVNVTAEDGVSDEHLIEAIAKLAYHAEVVSETTQRR